MAVQGKALKQVTEGQGKARHQGRAEQGKDTQAVQGKARCLRRAGQGKEHVQGRAGQGK
jgi:hypothetical protein